MPCLGDEVALVHLLVYLYALKPYKALSITSCMDLPSESVSPNSRPASAQHAPPVAGTRLLGVLRCCTQNIQGRAHTPMPDFNLKSSRLQGFVPQRQHAFPRQQLRTCGHASCHPASLYRPLPSPSD